MAGQIYSGDNGRYPKIKDARAFCAGRKHHAGDGVANPITENPFDGDGTDEETAWDLGWTARDNGDGKGNCAE